MNILRSVLFIPADKENMINKIDALCPDAFILDLEDSVSEENKEIARINISNKLNSLVNQKKIIFVRVNDIESSHVYKDIESTINNKIEGYMIPKFERINQLKRVSEFILKKEKELNIQQKIKLMLMIESPKGVIELRKLSLIEDEINTRIKVLVIGAEDYLFNLSVFGDISEDMVDYIRREIIIQAKAMECLAIDTVYRDFKNNQGLKKELEKIKAMGFNGKLAIHPVQIDIINSVFAPADEEIEKMMIILKHEEDFKRLGAINIDGVMYDPPHLKWAKKLKNYIDFIENKGKE